MSWCLYYRVHKDCAIFWLEWCPFEETRYFCHLFRKNEKLFSFSLFEAHSFHIHFFTYITLFKSNATDS